MDELGDIISGSVQEVVAFVQASERIRAILVTTTSQAQEMLELVNLDPALKPELEAAGGHLVEAVEALGRAQTFLTERMSVKLRNL